MAELALNPRGTVLQWPSTEDMELKNRLLNKYSGYLSSLWKELSRKKKKGKLPRDAHQKLLLWWQLHYMWPYPSVRNRIIHTSADLDHAGRPNEIMSAVAAAAWSITASLFFLGQGGPWPCFASTALCRCRLLRACMIGGSV